MAHTPTKIEAECRDLIANPPRYVWERGMQQGAYTWGEWHDAAVRAVDCEDYSEYEWMLAEDAEHEPEYDDDGYSDYLYDMARDEQLVRAYERELAA